MSAIPVVGLLLSLPLTMGAGSAGEDRGCGSGENWFGCPNDGRIYRDSLVRALDTAERVIISEHSDPLDLGIPEDDRPPMPVTEYRRVELNDAQTAFFRKALGDMNPATQNAYSACIPSIHHTVRFEAADRVLGTLRICFQCSQVFWDGTKVNPPGAIYKALWAIVRNSGLEPERDWRKLAFEARSTRK